MYFLKRFSKRIDVELVILDDGIHCAFRNSSSPLLLEERGEVKKAQIMPGLSIIFRNVEEYIALIVVKSLLKRRYNEQSVKVMKQYWFVLVILYSLEFFHATAVPADSLKAVPEIYQAIRTTPNVKRIAGVNLSEYDYRQVEQYVVTNTERLFVLGQTTVQEHVVSSIAPDSHEQTIIARYPIEGFFPIDEIAFTVFFTADELSSAPYLVVTYTENNSGMRAELLSTIIEVFREKEDGTYQMINREEIERVNIAYQQRQPDSEYIHLAVNESPTEDKAGPARKIQSDISVKDVNDDGYADILVEKHVYQSRKINEAVPSDDELLDDDFIFEKSELWGMLFLSRDMKFSELTLLSQP